MSHLAEFHKRSERRGEERLSLPDPSIGILTREQIEVAKSASILTMLLGGSKDLCKKATLEYAKGRVLIE